MRTVKCDYKDCEAVEALKFLSMVPKDWVNVRLAVTGSLNHGGNIEFQYCPKHRPWDVNDPNQYPVDVIEDVIRDIVQDEIEEHVDKGCL